MRPMWFVPSASALLLVTVHSLLLAAGQPGGNILARADSLLAAGDTAAAILLLDTALAQDPKDYPAHLRRGQLYLAAGDTDKAESEFRRSLFSSSRLLRGQAHIGLGDISATFDWRRAEAISCYRMAIRIDPGSLVARYKLASVSMAMDTGEGVERAAEELVDIICIDPTYQNSFLIWRDLIKIKQKGHYKKVAECLERYCSGHDGQDSLLLDAALCRYMVDQPEDALPLLDRVAGAAPGFHPERRFLLRARCLVELDDTVGFQAAYDSALAAAEETGDFSELVNHAATIYRPEEKAKAEILTTPEQWAAFFRVFWGRRDPDPLSPVNERLFEHYKRLREAEQYYTIPNPYVRYLRSKVFNRLVNSGSSQPGYDPSMFWDRNRDLYLEQRGLLLIRHGPPDEIKKPGSEGVDERGRPILNSGPPPEAEVWRYGSLHFPFIYKPLTGGQYLFEPFVLPGFGDINQAMDTESFTDPLPELEQQFCGVEFMAPGGGNELEVYQSLGVGESGMAKPPRADLAVYDLTWTQLDQDSGTAFRAELDGEPSWVAVNSVNAGPGEKQFAVRLDIPGHRAVRRSSIILSTFLRDRLELSGIVLGGPVEPGQAAHTRHGVDLLPRPSLLFDTGETMTVYLEIYGLKIDRYTAKVTVSRIREMSILGKVKSLLTAAGAERSSSLTLTFEREGVEPAATVPETFSLDTSLLLPGEYRIGIEVSDEKSGNTCKVGCIFKLNEPQ